MTDIKNFFSIIEKYTTTLYKMSEFEKCYRRLSTCMIYAELYLFCCYCIKNNIDDDIDQKLYDKVETLLFHIDSK